MCRLKVSYLNSVDAAHSYHVSTVFIACLPSLENNHVVHLSVSFICDLIVNVTGFMETVPNHTLEVMR